MAGLIVRKFGMDTMDVIENEPEKLARVPVSGGSGYKSSKKPGKRNAK